jgi:hypothetical protein
MIQMLFAETLCENSPHLEMAGRLHEEIEVARSVHDAMEFDLVTADNVENEIGFNDVDAIAVFSMLWMPWYSS